MPLTPSDVANKQFKVAFRGYSLDEVDAFLDEVESELGRLLRENDELKTSGSRAASAPPEAVPAPVVAERPLDSLEGQEAALRTLLLAQRTADEAVAEARAEAAQIVEAARAEADSTLSTARAEADTTLTDARAEAERTVTEAQALAERTVAEA
ncbi:MAG: DivIVA family protein, partial [Frankiales bacterium]|nr:DivIVA family protein [Frankiales bacterium]